MVETVRMHKDREEAKQHELVSFCFFFILVCARAVSNMKYLFIINIHAHASEEKRCQFNV